MGDPGIEPGVRLREGVTVPCHTLRPVAHAPKKRRERVITCGSMQRQDGNLCDLAICLPSWCFRAGPTMKSTQTHTGLTLWRACFLVLGYALGPVISVISFSLALPNFSEDGFRICVLVALLVYMIFLGERVERAIRAIVARNAWLRGLHPKRINTLRDIAVMAVPSSTILVAPGGSLREALAEIAALSFGTAIVLVIYNECEMALKRWRKS